MVPISWTAPRTWVAAETPTAANLNSNLRDNMKEVYRKVAYTETDLAGSSGSLSIGATSAGSATTIVTAGAFTADGVSPIIVQFYAPQIACSDDVNLELYDGSSSIGTILARVINANIEAFVQTDEQVLSAASHTLSIRGWSTTGTTSVKAGAGGSAGTLRNLYIRVLSKGGA